MVKGKAMLIIFLVTITFISCNRFSVIERIVYSDNNECYFATAVWDSEKTQIVKMFFIPCDKLTDSAKNCNFKILSNIKNELNK